jgi:hypothetical protein
MTLYDTPYQEQDPSQVVAQALCNLSIIYRMRMRILDEGAIEKINSDILPYADPETRSVGQLALRPPLEPQAFM